MSKEYYTKWEYGGKSLVQGTDGPFPSKLKAIRFGRFIVRFGIFPRIGMSGRFSVESFDGNERKIVFAADIVHKREQFMLSRRNRHAEGLVVVEPKN